MAAANTRDPHPRQDVDGDHHPIDRYRAHDTLQQLLPDDAEIIGADEQGHIVFHSSRWVYHARLDDYNAVSLFERRRWLHADPVRHAERYTEHGRGQWRWLRDNILHASELLQTQQQAERTLVEQALPVVRDRFAANPYKQLVFLYQYLGSGAGAPDVFVEDRRHLAETGGSPDALQPAIRGVVPEIGAYFTENAGGLSGELALQVLWQIHALDPDAVAPAVPYLKTEEVWATAVGGVDGLSVAHVQGLIEAVDGEAFDPPVDPRRRS
jgi:hypothetical protein